MQAPPHRSSFPEQIKRSGTDLVLALKHWPVESGSPRAWVFILHGLGEHSGRYNPLAAFLNKNGIAVVAIDHEGHGKSGGTRAYISYYQHVVNDALYAIDLAHKYFGPIPKFLFGHSMGGAIAATTALRRPAGFEWNGVILSAPALQKGADISDLAVMAGKALAWIMPRVALQQIPPEQITSIPEEVKRYQDDPLNYHGGILIGTGHALLEMMDHIQANYVKFTFPILVLQGDDDKICDPAGARKFIDAIPAKDKKLITYKARHEIHYDIEREKEEQDILRWITARMTSSAKL